MAKGVLWVPRGIYSTSNDYYDGFTIYDYGAARENIKYDMIVGPYLGEPFVLSQWKMACYAQDVYVAIYSVGFTEYWAFKKTICSAFDYSSGRITLVCSTCNVQRIQALPDCISSLQSLMARDIYLGRARGELYNRHSEGHPTYGAKALGQSRYVPNQLAAAMKLMPGLRTITFPDFDAD